MPTKITMIGPNYVVHGDEQSEHVRFAEITLGEQTFRLEDNWDVRVLKPLPRRAKPLNPKESCRFYTDRMTPIVWIGGEVTAGIAAFIQCIEEGYFVLEIRGSQPHPLPAVAGETERVETLVKSNGHAHQAVPNGAAVETRELVLA